MGLVQEAPFRASGRPADPQSFLQHSITRLKENYKNVHGTMYKGTETLSFPGILFAR